jgi:hypothetical protein
MSDSTTTNARQRRIVAALVVLDNSTCARAASALSHSLIHIAPISVERDQRGCNRLQDVLLHPREARLLSDCAAISEMQQQQRRATRDAKERDASWAEPMEYRLREYMTAQLSSIRSITSISTAAGLSAACRRADARMSPKRRSRKRPRLRRRSRGPIFGTPGVASGMAALWSIGGILSNEPIRKIGEEARPATSDCAECRHHRHPGSAQPG